MTTYTTPQYKKELSWYARLTYIIKNYKFLKRLDMYYDLKHDEKERAKVNLNPEDFFNGA